MEFHISRNARDFYRFDETLYALSGNVIFANLYAVRRFVQKMNNKKDLVSYPELAVRSGDVNAMGLIDEILHLVMAQYREEINPVALMQAMVFVKEEIGEEQVKQTLRIFSELFPPVAVYRGETSLDDYLQGSSDGIPHETAVLEEMILLWLANMNPAFFSFSELFEDERLRKETEYLTVIESLGRFFESNPHFGPDDEPLFTMLRSPAIAEPHSLEGQLEYIRKRWGKLLGKYLYKLLGSLDLMQEEKKMSFQGPGPSRVYDYGELDADFERFSADSDWMPRVVMMAKNTYVWLDQLSRKYSREIHRLDEIPDEELDLLARWGFTALWLIGLWERSKASKRIKQLCGNPEAEASAYSLKGYTISADLGGDEAYENLKARAWLRGIRMAGDMVPNHVGIDGDWVLHHPDWFVGLDQTPYPSYSFTGENLSLDDRVGIYLEDHYFERSDAAVVFKRVDHLTGEEKYIYHGNDGTSMPWNDTAQLNYLNAEVREAVIQTILHVARQFPIIRFDAAMTLAKRHIQRLWFPEPGSGGAIPSRSEHALTRSQFEEAIPKEFWREVVDRVAAELPDTLLLAEAFWMLEGYFVRSLGMHRVYNSAFMNMLKNEDNSKYRDVIKKTIQFDPEILKRFVNFMNNPDEDTAVAQFGKEDKYFGVCVLLATMPGLPMFGHGQIEGYTEKYGMEFRRAYWDEQPDPWLLGRHEREIFPLLRQRHLFSGVRHFLLYDFFAAEGHVDENVFAYSNRSGEEKVLVLVNNAFNHAKGWIRMSAGFVVKSVDSKQMLQLSLGEGLGLSDAPDTFCVFRDQITGLEFIRSTREIHENGLYVELHAYKYHVFLEFREVVDREGHPYRELNSYLAGRGVPSVEEAVSELFLQPVHAAFKMLVNPTTLYAIVDALQHNSKAEPNPALVDDVARSMEQLADEIARFAGCDSCAHIMDEPIGRELKVLLKLPSGSFFKADQYPQIVEVLDDLFTDKKLAAAVMFHWITLHRIGCVLNRDEGLEMSRSLIDEWLLGRIVAEVLQEVGLEAEQVWQAGMLIKILTVHQNWIVDEDGRPVSARTIIENWLRDPEVRQFLRINRHQDVLWYHEESLESLIRFMTAVVLIRLYSDTEIAESKMTDLMTHLNIELTLFDKAREQADYQVQKLIDGLDYEKF